MSCFPELTYATYADGELPVPERREVERHLAGCARCRDLVAALREENRALVAALEAPAPARVPGPAPAWPRAAAWGGLALAALSLGWLALRGPSVAPDWWTLGLEALVFVLLHAGTLTSLVAAVAVGVMAALTLAGALWLLRPAPRALGGTAALLLVAGLPGPVVALETRAGATVTVASGETVDGTLVASGDTVRIEGVVGGDLIVAARTLELRGIVRGDLIVGGVAADLRGTVEGNVYSLVGDLELRDTVTRSVYGLNRATVVGPDARVGADVALVGRRLDVDGAIGRGVWVFGEAVRVAGAIGRDLVVRAHRLHVLASARIGGDVTAEVGDTDGAAIDPGAAIAGSRRVRVASRSQALLAEPALWFWVATSLFGAVLLGLVGLTMVPRYVRESAEAVRVGWRTLGAGALVLVVGPVALVLGAITLVGLPLALTGLALYLLGLYAAKIVVGLAVGHALLGRPWGTARESLVPLVLGLVILAAAVRLPLVGPVLQLLVLCLGLGALTCALARGTGPVA